MTSSKRVRNHSLVFVGILVCIIVVILLIGFFVYHATHKSASPQSTTSTSTPSTTSTSTSSGTSTSTQSGSASTGAFSVRGTRILKSNGEQYIPLGVTIFGLAKYNWSVQEASDIAKINSIANFWHGNIVRLQISPVLLDANTDGYLAAVENEVRTAESDGLNVILSAQYEKTNRKRHHGRKSVENPDDSTVTFWKTIAPIYSKDSRVWFDLFNEPAGVGNSFEIWKNGGNGVIGMQTLVNDIRAVAPNNVILAEGPDYARTLHGLAGDTLSGGNIVYSVHPYLHSTKTLPLSEWQLIWKSYWGNIATELPVVIGEWGASQSNGVGCQPNLPTLVPAFLSYISSLHLGLIGWSLIPGAMIRGHNLEQPTKFDQGVSFECTKGAGTPVQGAGADILRYLTNDGVYSN
jgi:Cellulase (glycosyl hydrolase family 5)